MSIDPSRVVDAAEAVAAAWAKKLGEFTVEEVVVLLSHAAVLAQAAPQIAGAFRTSESPALRMEEGITLPTGFELDTNFYKRGVFEGMPSRCHVALTNAEATTPRMLLAAPRRKIAHRTNAEYLVQESNVGSRTVREVRECLREAGFNPDEFSYLQKLKK